MGVEKDEGVTATTAADQEASPAGEKQLEQATKPAEDTDSSTDHSVSKSQMSSKQRKRTKRQALEAADGLSGAGEASQPEANRAVRKSVGEDERLGRDDGVDGQVPSGEGESAAPAPVEEGGGKAITPARQPNQIKSSKGKAKKKKHEKDEARKAALKRAENEAQERTGGRGGHAADAAADVVVMVVDDDSNRAEPTDIVETNGKDTDVKDTDVKDTDAGNGDPKVNAEDEAGAHTEGQTIPGERTNTSPSEEKDAALLVVGKPASKKVKTMAADRLSKWAMKFTEQR